MCSFLNSSSLPFSTYSYLEHPLLPTPPSVIHPPNFYLRNQPNHHFLLGHLAQCPKGGTPPYSFISVVAITSHLLSIFPNRWQIPWSQDYALFWFVYKTNFWVATQKSVEYMNQCYMVSMVTNSISVDFVHSKICWDWKKTNSMLICQCIWSRW